MILYVFQKKQKKKKKKGIKTLGKNRKTQPSIGEVEERELLGRNAGSPPPPCAAVAVAVAGVATPLLPACSHFISRLCVCFLSCPL